MATPPPSLNPPLTSLWDGLSPHLIATFYEVDQDGKRLDDQVSVQAPLTEANFELTLNWQSPFEQAGPESKAPALLAMLQSGALQPMIETLLGKSKAGASSAQQKSAEFLKQFEGRTGITKLNSTQVFTGMPPARGTVTALFRAWRDPVNEVERPVDQLMAWALPRELAEDSTILTRTAQAAQGDLGAIETLLPSKSPSLVAMKYKGYLYAPLVIESIGKPIGSPVTGTGHYAELLVPMTLCTLTALDRQMWAKLRIQ